MPNLSRQTLLEAAFDLDAPEVSFEFFPPKTEEMEQKLWEAVTQLAPLAPHFVSVTYGAGGSTRERTHHTVKRILEETTLKPAAHLTCVGASREEVDRVARDYWQAGVRHIVALRGDAPQGSGEYIPHPQGYAYACDLVEGLRKVADFEISVAAYPETHPTATSAKADIDYLKRKIDAGATRAITQYFFDVEHYFRFIDQVRAAGIDVPVIPGILPIGNLATMLKFNAQCGASVPQWLLDQFDGLEQQPELRNIVAVNIAAQQCRELMKQGIRQLHFYTLNRSDLTRGICRLLGVKEQVKTPELV